MTFLEENVGKKYELTTGKLFGKNYRAPESGKDSYDSFFCSELVAAAYKELGMLPPDKASGQYWPVSFAQEKNLQLLKGAKLGIEMLINISA